jgi:hypothetical protein
MSAKAHLLWHKGRPLELVLPGLEAYDASHGLVPAGLGGLAFADISVGPVNPYCLSWARPEGIAVSECVARPWDLRLLADPAFRRLSLELLRDRQHWYWVSFYSYPGEGSREAQTCIVDGKLARLIVSFDEEPNSWTLTPEETQRAVRKYREIQELYEVLECDEVNGYSDTHYSAGTDMKEDPEHLQKIFRFARKGRQILTVPMEEGRVRRADEHDWRLVVDP